MARVANSDLGHSSVPDGAVALDLLRATAPSLTASLAQRHVREPLLERSDSNSPIATRLKAQTS